MQWEESPRLAEIFMSKLDKRKESSIPKRTSTAGRSGGFLRIRMCWCKGVAKFPGAF